MIDPLHGVTLEALLTELVERRGWEELAREVPIRCFQNEPSIPSSLSFLRKAPWARAKVERLWLKEQRIREKKRLRNARRAARRAFAASMPVERPETLGLFWPADTPAPSYSVAAGFRVVPGVDREAFVAVQRAIGVEVTQETWDGLALVDDAMVVAHDQNGPVAVACAQRLPHGWAELAWVAVVPSARGNGLGKTVCCALVEVLLAEGETRIFGSTQDERIHALGIYLSMGFTPVKRPEKDVRWVAVREALGRTEGAAGLSPE